IAVDVPREAKTRTEVPKVFVIAGSVGKARISVEEQTRRRVSKAGGMRAGAQRSLVVMDVGPVIVNLRQPRFPADAIVHRYPLAQLPCIGEISIHVVSMVTLFDLAPGSPGRHLAHQEVRQSEPVS